MELKMWVYTPTLEKIGELEIQRSVIWEEKAFSAGSFSIESIITPETLTMLQPENIIWIDGETAGIIEYVQENADETGPYITVKGSTLTGILDRRVLWGLYNLKGTVPQIMNALVDDCCVNPTRGDVEPRKIPGLVLFGAPTGGSEIQFQKTGGTLLEALEALGGTHGVAFGVRFNPAVPRMEFWTRYGQDRTIYQDGLNPVLYSTELDDVLSSEYLYNSQDYRNVALVAGEGEGNERVYVTVENEDETPDVPVPPTPPEPPATEMYTVTLLVDPAGSGTASGGKTVAAGVSITVTAMPSDGYTFSEWQENGVAVSTSSSYTFTVTADRTLTAVFTAVIPTYTITVTIDPPGYGTVTGSGTYKEGDTVTLKATAGDGYKFTEWRENGTAVHSGETYTFTASADRTLTAAFAVKPSSRLPDGYTEVQYIESSNSANCYIQTNISPVLNATRTVLDIDVAAYTSGTQYIVNANASNSRYYYLARTGDTEIVSTAGTAGKTLTTTSIANKRTTIDWDLQNNALTVGGETYSITSTSATMGTKLKIFSSGIAGKIYSVQIYESGNIQADFVPCVSPSNVVGMYDLVGKAFYGSAGSVSFTSGPAV